jgi:hypothetical protein
VGNPHYEKQRAIAGSMLNAPPAMEHYEVAGEA